MNDTRTPQSRTLWNPDDLDRFRMQSDALADEVVRRYGDNPRLAANLLDSLVRTGEGNTSEDSALVAGFRERTKHLPPWADRAKILQAQRLLSNSLIPATILLAAGSLPQCYLDRLGTPVLVATQQLTEHVFRRLIQTSHMVFNVYEPGSLFADPGRPEQIPVGIDKTQTVRLMHALMRHLMLRDDYRGGAPKSMAEVLWSQHWDVQTLGKPINQEDEAFVLLTFSYVTIEGFARLAIILTDEEKDAIVHLWSVVGYVLGVNEGLLAHSYDDAAVLFALFRARLRGSSEAGQRLTKALIDWINSLLPPFLRWFDAGTELVTFLNGEDDAEVLGVGPSGLDRVVHAVLESLLPSYDKVATYAGRPPLFARLAEYLADKMVAKVWEVTQQGARQMTWPPHFMAAAQKK